jgi:uncharacterized membrane protein (UPF0136 family)
MLIKGPTVDAGCGEVRNFSTNKTATTARHFPRRDEKSKGRVWRSSFSKTVSCWKLVERFPTGEGQPRHEQPLVAVILPRRTSNQSTTKVTSIDNARANGAVFSANNDDNRNEESDRTVKMYDFCVTYPWAILVAASGCAGFLLKRSIPSLVSGLVLGALLFLFANKSLQHWQENRPTRKYTFLSLCVTALLLGIMAPKYILRNGAFFPSGMLTIGGGITGLYYIILLLMGGNAALGKKKQ